MNKNIIIIMMISYLLSACTGSNKSNSDVQCEIIENKAGARIKEYDFISLNYILRTQEGKVLSSSGKFDQRPLLMFRTKPYFKGDLNSALGELSEGDSAIIKLSLDSMRLKMNYHITADSKSKYLVYEVRINKVITRGKLNDQMLNQNFEQLKEQEIYKAKISEDKKISDYITAKHLQPQSTVSGLRYTLLKNGNGFKTADGDTALVNYTLSSLDGKVFETNRKDIAKRNGVYYAQGYYKPLKTPVNQKSGTGFTEAASMFTKGSKTTVIIPSKLAYGKYGKRSIDPYTPLLCEMEIVDILPHR
jgi:FKBP-type peptidyl-prolyl cis-trans isomerase FkpA